MGPKPTPAELGPDVTIAIAAITQPDGYIVAISDRMISYDDVTQAEDNAVLKGQAIAEKWGLMFSANDARLFNPIWSKIAERLPPTEEQRKKPIDLDEMKEAVVAGYREIFAQEFTARFLSRFGIKSVDDFRREGLSELGKDVFGSLCDELAKFDIGISLLCHGYDIAGSPHIFEVENPGRVIDHDLLGYAVIGSGYWMASASLRRRPFGREFEPTIYRLLEAKFAAETASGVGRSTTAMTFNAKGDFHMMNPSEVENVRKAWESSLTRVQTH